MRKLSINRGTVKVSGYNPGVARGGRMSRTTLALVLSLSVAFAGVAPAAYGQ